MLIMPVATEWDEATAIVRMDWPEVRNSLDAKRAIELQECLLSVQRRPDCRAIVLAGAGTAFCAGGDLGFFMELMTEQKSHVERLIESIYQPLVTTILSSMVPVLAAVDGPAVGLGMDIAMACDLCLVGPKGWLAQGWSRVGLVPAAGGLLFLERIIPRHEIWK